MKKIIAVFFIFTIACAGQTGKIAITIEIRDKIRDVLKEMGYQNGYVSVDNYDWYMDVLLQNAVKEKKHIHLEKLKKFM